MQHQEGQEAQLYPQRIFHRNGIIAFFREDRADKEATACSTLLMTLASRTTWQVGYRERSRSSWKRSPLTTTGRSSPYSARRIRGPIPSSGGMCGPIGRTCWIRQKEGSSLETVMKRGLCDSGKGTREHERR